MLVTSATYNHIENLLKDGKRVLEAADLEELGSVYERQLTNLASDHIPFVQEELICFGKKLIRKYNVSQVRNTPDFENDLGQRINNRLIKQEILLGLYAEGTKILSQCDNSDEKLSIELKIREMIETNRDLENRLEQALKEITDARTTNEATKELKSLLTSGIDATKFLAFAEAQLKGCDYLSPTSYVDSVFEPSRFLYVNVVRLLHVLVDLNRKEHFDAIVPLICLHIDHSRLFVDPDPLPVQILQQLMLQMPKDERLVNAAKKSHNCYYLS